MASPRTVEEIFKDYNARRSALVRALTVEADEVYLQCDPEKENLCLYGHPNESWEVTLPAEEVPPELPEPALGINFARDGMTRKDWLSLVAVHSDSWLLSVGFYFGARLNRNESGQEILHKRVIKHFKTWNGGRNYFLTLHEHLNGDIERILRKLCQRKRLFSMVNDLPTLFEIVTGRKPVEDKLSADGGSKSRNNTKRSTDGQARSNSKLSYVEDEDEHGDTLCGSCGGNYNADEFWIGCDICERWYHGKCVKITPAKAESIKQYKCPSCSTKKSRH